VTVKHWLHWLQHRVLVHYRLSYVNMLWWIRT